MQGHLFESPISAGIEQALRVPVAAKNDPAPSHEAAEKITRGGKREGQLLGVLALVKRYPLHTSLELAHRPTKYDRFTIARRLPELAKAGLVIRRKARKCKFGETSATTWEAVE